MKIISADHSGYNVGYSKVDLTITKQKLRKIFEEMKSTGVGCNLRFGRHSWKDKTIEERIPIDRNLADRIKSRIMPNGLKKDHYLQCNYPCGFSQAQDEYVDFDFTIEKQEGNRYKIEGGWPDAGDDECEDLTKAMKWRYDTSY